MNRSKHNLFNPEYNKAINKKQLAEAMGISLSTLQRRLKDAEIEVPRGLIPPSKVNEILSALNWFDLDSNDVK